MGFVLYSFHLSFWTLTPPLHSSLFIFVQVTPRKKFVCPSCSSEPSLWSDDQHYIERDECVNIFEQFFGGMPLKAVKFRLDPLLYKTGVPEKMQDYPDMGEL